MMDVASYGSGCRVISSTSRDEQHPPVNMIDGYLSTFWCSTGLFPHEFIIQFESNAKINGLKLECSDVKDIMIEKTEFDNVNDFQPLAEKTLPATNGSLQQHSFNFPETEARHLRFIIKSGYTSFVSVHHVSVDGTFTVRTDRFR
ncbi:intraflagellar transport protein 25 homolog [Rhopilema esculentum]|uniref:intraflagellar transport protein 25 homolog n=1 Tax=Rhopilema esculentum TaxID=499914 RepID=UPI0031D80FB9